MATPILLAALGELLVEESGVVNIGIEGAMLVGAFAALTIAYFSGSSRSVWRAQSQPASRSTPSSQSWL